jgi:predicted anti-sigma-YlaC factor YlaD
MACDTWREAISAIADGEVSPVDVRLLDAHVSRCPSCSEFREVVEATRQAVRLRTAVPTSDLTGRIVKANALAERRARWNLARAALAVVAVEVVVFSVPDLLGDASGSSAHAARHLGAFSVAYAVALLVVVVRPTRARIMLPVAAVLAGALLITAAIDLAAGEVPLVSEATHLPELLSVVLLWLLARPSPAAADAPSRVVLRRLRLVAGGTPAAGSDAG